jgi:hypothetical protein
MTTIPSTPPTVTLFGDTINLTGLLAAAPKAMQPWLAIYGPSLLGVAVKQAQDAFAQVLQGNPEPAQQLVFDAMTPDAKDAKVAADIAAANADADTAAANKAAESKAFQAAVAIALSLLLTLVGLGAMAFAKAWRRAARSSGEKAGGQCVLLSCHRDITD